MKAVSTEAASFFIEYTDLINTFHLFPKKSFPGIE